MAIQTTTTKNLRIHFSLANNGTRSIDIENPIDAPGIIQENLNAIKPKFAAGGDYNGILVGNDFFDGDTDATVTSLASAEIINVTKTVETTDLQLT